MRNIIFDLDGTLLNTMADIGSACNEILSRHGYPTHPLPAYAKMVGNGFDKLIERALPQGNMPDDAARATLVAEAREWYAAHMMVLTRPYPGMPVALDILARRGCKLAVLSNKPDAMSVILIPHYFPKIPFVFARGALPDVPLKPDPTSLNAMLKDMGAEKSQSCYVGDSDVDMLTARNAGVMGVGCAWGFRGEAELKEARAAVILSAPAELLALT